MFYKAYNILYNINNFLCSFMYIELKVFFMRLSLINDKKHTHRNIFEQLIFFIENFINGIKLILAHLFFFCSANLLVGILFVCKKCIRRRMYALFFRFWYTILLSADFRFLCDAYIVIVFKFYIRINFWKNMHIMPIFSSNCIFFFCAIITLLVFIVII